MTILYDGKRFPFIVANAWQIESLSGHEHFDVYLIRSTVSFRLPFTNVGPMSKGTTETNGYFYPTG